MSSHQNRSPGMGEVNVSDLPGETPPSGQYAGKQQLYRQGTVKMSDWLIQRAAHPSSTIPSSFEPASKCILCLSLSYELNCSRAVIHELSIKLATATIELDRTCDEVASCHGKIQDLEEEVKISKEHLADLEKLCSDLNKKCSDLTKTCSLTTQQKGETLNTRRNLLLNYDEYTTPDITVNDLERQESSSKHNDSAPRRPDHKQNSDSRPFKKNEDESETVQRVERQRPGPNQDRGDRSGGYRSNPHDGNNWNNKEIRPTKQQDKNVPVEANADASTAPLTGAKKSTRQFYESKPRNTDNGPTSSQESNSLPNLVQEVKRDLFDMSEEYALAHCVGSDLIMSSGVAVQFRKRFRSVPDLVDQNKKPGEVAFITSGTRYIYYLVSKTSSTGKPNWEDFESCIVEWSKLCVEHDVKKIAIPKIGCGRDQLDWIRVRNLLNKHFANKGIEIVVCVIECESAPERKWSLKLCHSKDPLSMLDPRDCGLLFIASKDRFFTEGITRLATKYGFSSDYRSDKFSLGSLYHYKNKALNANVFGLVVKEHHDDPVSFTAIGSCLQHLRRAIRKSGLWYLGFEAFDDPKFSNATRKMWTVIIDTFFVEELEVYICWPSDVKEKNWEEPLYK